METELTSRFGTLKFTFRYKLEGAEMRPHPYNSWQKTDMEYRPTELTFTLDSHSGITDDELPRYAELKAVHATLRGPKLKKDGTPGLQTVREEFYYGNYPAWIAELIEAAAAELRKEKA